MDKELKAALQQKLSNLTIERARDFWNEICEYLDAMMVRCDNALRKLDATDLDIRKAQIMRDVCTRLKGLPERMVESVKKQLAEGSSGEKDDLDVLNFFKPSKRR
jgi:hypothetical protein